MCKDVILVEIQGLAYTRPLHIFAGMMRVKMRQLFRFYCIRGINLQTEF